MAEYGQGVGQATGAAGGGGGGTQDLGAGAMAFVNHAVHTVSTMPPAQLALLAVVVILGLIFLRRAF